MKPDVGKMIERLHAMVDGFETQLQWAVDNDIYATARLTFAAIDTGRNAYTLVIGFEEPMSDDGGEDDDE